MQGERDPASSCSGVTPTEGNGNCTRQLRRELKALYFNLFSFKKAIRLEYEPEVCLPKTLSIPTTKTKAALVSFLFYCIYFSELQGSPSPLWIQMDHLCQRTSLGLREMLLKSFFSSFCIQNAVDYIKCQIFSKHFPRDSPSINSSHIYRLTLHTLSAVLPTAPLVLLQESEGRRFALAANWSSGSQYLSGPCTRENKLYLNI